MARARCTLSVKGLDCPVEADVLRGALHDVPGVLGLGFDLIHGTLTIDHDPAFTSPGALAARGAERAGMRGEPIGDSGDDAPAAPASPWRSAFSRWGATAGSGFALGAAVVVAYLGDAGGLS